MQHFTIASESALLTVPKPLKQSITVKELLGNLTISKISSILISPSLPFFKV